MDIEIGWIDHEVAAEFPDLRLHHITLDARARVSPPELQGQLADLSTRFRGRQALELPRKPIPSAYRAFFRQVGLDPDVDRNPAEAVSFDRILRGRFVSRDHLSDALTAAVIETHIALGLIDADAVNGPLGIRPVRATDTTDIPVGVLAIADADQAVAPLFGPTFSTFAPTYRTRRVAVTAIGVAGVEDWMVGHGLWRVADLLGAL